MHKDGLLTRLDTAFSRDQAQKVYVQDRMREHSAELFEWLERGAYFYVCGDATRMAKDVEVDVAGCDCGGFAWDAGAMQRNTWLR